MPISVGKGGERRGLAERVVVPLGSAVVLGAAAVHSIIDRRRRNGTGAGGRPEPDPEGATKGGFLDKLASRWPALEPVAAVQRRFGELGGNQLAAAFTFIAFLSLFPLLLVAVAVVGFLSAGSDTDLAARIVSELGLEGEAARTLTEAVETAESSRQAASVLGLAGLLWSGLGLVGGLQYIYNAAWQVKGQGLKGKAMGLVWLAGATVLFVLSAGVTTGLRWLPGVMAPVGILVGFGVSFGLWLWTGRVLPARAVPWRSLVPGAIAGAAGLELLKLVAAHWVPRAVASSSALYGSLGVVFAVLAWLAFFARLVVYSAVINVVSYERRSGTVHAVVAVPSTDAAASQADTDATPPVANRSGRLVTPS